MTLIASLGNHDGDSKENVKKQQALTSKTMSLQVRYTLWYISLPCSAKQQSEVTSFKVLGRTGTHDGEFLFL